MIKKFTLTFSIIFLAAVATQAFALENPNVAPVGETALILTPDRADCGSREVKGPYLSDEWISKKDCTQEVSVKDKSFAVIERGVSGGVAEFHFQLPEGLDVKSVVSMTATVDMFCSGGIGVNAMNEIGGWANLGEDLPSEQYKPDGTYGYLSCGSGQQKKVMVVPLPVNEEGNTFAFRLTEGELSAEALIDHVFVSVISNTVEAASPDSSSQGSCTVNGQPVDCGEVANTIGNIFWGIGAFMLLAVLFAIFWLFMLVHAITKPIDNKILWIVLLLLIGPISAIVYYFVVKRHFINTPQNPSPFTPPTPSE